MSYLPADEHYTTLDAAKNTANVFTGPGCDSMTMAATQWAEVLYAMDAEVYEQFLRMLGGLKEQWSGPSAKHAAEAAEPFRQWLDGLTDQLAVVCKQTAVLRDAYVTLREAMLRPEVIAQNRRQSTLLRGNNMLGTFTEEIEALDDEYERSGRRAVRLMTVYDSYVSKALEALHPWKEPPAIVNETGFVPAASAVSWAGDDAAPNEADQATKKRRRE